MHDAYINYIDRILKEYSTGPDSSEELDEYESFEGDMMLTASQKRELNAAALNDGPIERKFIPILSRRSGLRDVTKLWPGGVFRYQLKEGSWKSRDKVRVRRILKEFEEEISWAFPPVGKCISFLETKTGYRVHVIGPEKTERCSAGVGFLGHNGNKKFQRMKLGKVCLKKPAKVKHEVMHSLGIWHQQMRSDRKDHVEILHKNIPKNKWKNFKSYHNKVVNEHGVPYDLLSTMHYSAFAFSKNSKETIKTHEENGQEIIGNREVPRLNDIELIRKMYNCKELDIKYKSRSEGSKLMHC